MKAGKLLLLLILTGTINAQTLHFKKHEVEPDNRTVANVEAAGPRWTAGRSHLILQFRHPVNDRIINELNQRGAFVVGAVPDFGVAVSALDTFSVDGLDLAWAGRLDIDTKISPLLDRRKEPQRWVVAEFFPDVDMQEAQRMVQAAGFEVHRHPDLVDYHLLISGDPNRLLALAQWDEVAYIFPASRDLIHGARVHHCAGALTTGGVTGTYAGPTSGWPKDATGQVTLSYVFSAITPKLDPAQATQAILQALNAWTQYAPVKFVPGQNAAAPRTINILFAQGDHGDGYPFDGQGGILAHTFYPAPYNAEPIAGDMHFDGAENWHIGADTDLYTVALHETGHALGLVHVDDPAALMYPYYRLGEKIAATDIATVAALYGSAATTAPVIAPSLLSLTIATPAANSTTAVSTIPMTGTTAGATGTVHVTWQTNTGASGTATGTTQWTIPVIPLTTGLNTITVTAADASHKAVQTLAITRTAQTTTSAPAPGHPAVTITSPSTSTTNTSAATVTVTGKAADTAAITKVTWQSGSYTGNAIGTTAWTAANLPLLVGNNIVTIRAYDAAGNQVSQSILVVRK